MAAQNQVYFSMTRFSIQGPLENNTNLQYIKGSIKSFNQSVLDGVSFGRVEEMQWKQKLVKMKGFLIFTQ